MQTLRRVTTLLLTLLAWTAQAQVVTTQPVFFTETTPVTINFDASQGNAALKDFTGDVYIWTGTVTNLSPTNTTWRNVKSPSFGQADPAALMTRDAANLYHITFTPRTYYPVPANETILRLGMIFKNAAGTVVGRATGGGDIFVDVAQAGLSARIVSPVPNAGGNPLFVNLNDQIAVTGTASAASSLSFKLNGTQVAQQANATTLSTTVTASQTGRSVVRFTASTGAGAPAADSLVFVVRPTVTVAALPAGAKDGITYLAGGTSVILNLTAPSKQFVYVLGEFNNWQATNAAYMNKTPDGNRWWVQINGLTPGREYGYQYLVDGELRVADPYSEKILQTDDSFIPAVTYPNLKPYPTGQTTGNVSVLQTNQAAYQWTATNFQRPTRADLVVYELHLRDFIARHDYQTLRDTLNYIQRLGINAIELMPINEFEGNESWGYNPSFYFAPDKYYGTKNELKRLIDECHRRGIAVVLDMVLNHSFGQSPMVQMYFANGKPAADSPWFNADATHPFNVGYDFNHESPFTKYFSKRVMEFWMQEYHVDGYRFDLSKGFTQRNNPNNVGAWGAYDQSRIDIWKDYYDFMKSVDTNVYCILEHFADNSEEKVLADYGMMLWGNLNFNYNEATMGYTSTSDFSWGYYGARNWLNPNLVTYMESHDEERQMFKNITYGNQTNPAHNVRDLNTALARSEAAAAFFFTVPGPKMVWQFGELGYDISIDQNGRIGNKPILWNYYQNPNRRKLYDVYRSLIALKKIEPVFENPTTYTQSLAGAAKSIHLANATTSVTVIGNFGVTATTIDPAFQGTGKWYNYLSGDSITVANVNAQIPLQPGAYAVYTSRRIRRSVLATRASQADVLHLSAAPNPARGTTTVYYDLPTAGPVQLTVRNVLGQSVLALPAARESVGSHTRELPLGQLAPGVYIVQLRADTQQQTLRLVVD